MRELPSKQLPESRYFRWDLAQKQALCVLEAVLGFFNLPTKKKTICCENFGLQVLA